MKAPKNYQHNIWDKKEFKLALLRWNNRTFDASFRLNFLEEGRNPFETPFFKISQDCKSISGKTRQLTCLSHNVHGRKQSFSERLFLCSRCSKIYPSGHREKAKLHYTEKLDKSLNNRQILSKKMFLLSKREPEFNLPSSDDVKALLENIPDRKTKQAVKKRWRLWWQTKRKPTKEWRS